MKIHEQHEQQDIKKCARYVLIFFFRHSIDVCITFTHPEKIDDKVTMNFITMFEYSKTNKLTNDEKTVHFVCFLIFLFCFLK